MELKELLNSEGYYIAQFQIKIYEVVNNYIKEKKITKEEFAKQINLSNKYISKILNGNFNGNINKFVKILLFCGKISDIKINYGKI